MSIYYQDNSVIIYHGDCREIMPTLEQSNLILTDPPYDICAGKGGGCFGQSSHLINTGGFTDNGVDYGFLDAAPNWFCFCSRKQLAELLAIAQVADRWNLITWCKPNPIPTCNNKYLPDVEYIIHHFEPGRLFGDISVKTCWISTPAPAGKKRQSKHPNEKPIKLIYKLVTLGTEIGDTILDPFAGSGTTGRAAKDLGRKAILIEREERYCEVAAKRIAQEVFNFA